MGKRSVVIDIGKFNTKICVFNQNGAKYALESGAIFDTPSDPMSDEFFQRCDIFLQKIGVKNAELYTIFSEDEENYTIETEFPSGSNKEIEKSVKERYAALSKDGAADCYYSWQTVGTPESTGQTRIMIAYAKKHFVNRMIKLAEKYKMKYKKADLSSTAIDGLARLLQRMNQIQTSPANTLYSLLDIGATSATLVLFTPNSIFKIVHISHSIYKLDEALTGSSSTLVYDKNLNREAVKMVPELVTQSPQYELLTKPLLTNIIREIISTTEGGRKFTVGPIFVTGGLAKLPYLIQKLASDLNTQCFEYPLQNYLDIAQNCIFRSNKKIYPCDEVFATALGTIVGGV